MLDKGINKISVSWMTWLTVKTVGPPSQQAFHMLSASQSIPSWTNKTAQNSLMLIFLLIQYKINQDIAVFTWGWLTLVRQPAKWWGTLNQVQNHPSWQCQPGSWSTGSPCWHTIALQQHRLYEGPAVDKSFLESEYTDKVKVKHNEVEENKGSERSS